MNCSDAYPLIDAYVDGELDLSRALEFERHVAECPACAERLKSATALHQRLTAPEMRFAAPTALRNRVRARIAEARDSETPAGKHPYLLERSSDRKRPAAGTYFALAAAAVIVLAVTSLVMLRTRDADRQLASEVVSAHVRSLMANHLLDVPSSDQHTVKPWFHGKLDFAPRVEDLSPAGYPLVGGRLEYLHGRSVAALIYQHRQHPINVFEWPSTEVIAPRNSTDAGFHLVHWSENGLEYWAVSDLNQQDLMQFVAMLRKQ